MIQAIQVLRFHLLELEKVIIMNLYVLDFFMCNDATCPNSLRLDLPAVIKGAAKLRINLRAVGEKFQVFHFPQNVLYYLANCSCGR